MGQQRTESETCDHIFLPDEQVANARRLLEAIADCYACGMSTLDITRVVEAAAVESQRKEAQG